MSNRIAAIKELLYKMADDQLIIGHRNAEWIGIGPILEEDIAFGSIAQDKTGHAFNFYKVLESLGEGEVDKIAFGRTEKDFKCCHLVEMPIGGYDFSLMRHYLFDLAEYLRFEMLSESSYEPIANLAKKYKSEIKYHVFHGRTWVKQLSRGTEISKAKMQSSLNEIYPLANGIFEPSHFEDDLISSGIFAGEKVLQTKWNEVLLPVLEEAGLTIPSLQDAKIGYGGRQGFHTENLEPLLTEMGEVFRMDAGAGW